MSIPKEPRQILINLMYIVLTAMLALNVSAEIMNAFLLMEKSIHHSSNITAHSNGKLLEAIHQQAEAYTQFSPLKEKAMEVSRISTEFDQYIASLKSELIQRSGGFDDKGTPKGIKNKDVTTRLFVAEGQGDQLEDQIEVVRAKLLELIADESQRMAIAQRIPLKVDEIPDDSDKKSWAQFVFQQMPVAAVLPILGKLQNDIKVAETTVLNHFLEQTGLTYKPDAFEAVISADKSYVIRGESLQADVFLSAYSSTIDNMSVKINGRTVPVTDGKATINIRPDGIGKRQLAAAITIENPLTGKVESFTKTFHYEVGERSVTATPDKMNVFYVGVDNPLSIVAAGVPSTQVQVDAPGLPLSRLNNGQYMVKPQRPGRSQITVSGGGLAPTSFEFRIKPIPNPVMKLGIKTGGPITPGELKVYTRLDAVLENFDFDAICRVQSFEVTRVPKNTDAIYATNTGGNFSEKTKRILSGANRGDRIYFDEIKVKCPGDIASRKLSGLVFVVR